jgi:ATP-dependent RNA/DNA helicase IGHMBP2
VLRSDASEVAAACREDAQTLAKRLVKLSGRKDAAERREVRGEMRRLAKEEKLRQSAAVTEVCYKLTGKKNGKNPSSKLAAKQ